MDFQATSSAASTQSHNWKPTGSMTSLGSMQSACSLCEIGGGRSNSRPQSDENEVPAASRCTIYILFVAFIGVNLVEGIVSNNISQKDGKERFGAKTDNYLEFNFAIPAMLDAFFRMAIAYPVMRYQKSKVVDCFRNVNRVQVFTTMFARFLVQASEVLGLVAVVYLVASTAKVIKQAQIPLVGLSGYLILKKSLSRDQTIYAIAIVPLAIQFCLLGGGSGENHLFGYIAAGLAVVVTAAANVFVEKLLKNDWSYLDTWSAQYTFALLDLPGMCVVYVMLTAFERSIGIECRSWNPLDESNTTNWMWILAFTCSGTMLGWVRLLLLTFADAMWLNLSCVLVMGCLWIQEVVQGEITGVKNSSNQFSTTKVLCLVGLTVILVGYEFATQTAEEREQEEEKEAALEEGRTHFKSKVEELEEADVMDLEVPTNDSNDVWELEDVAVVDNSTEVNLGTSTCRRRDSFCDQGIFAV